MKYVAIYVGALTLGMLSGAVLLEVEGKRRVVKVYGKGYWGYWKKTKEQKDVFVEIR